MMQPFGDSHPMNPSPVTNLKTVKREGGVLVNLFFLSLKATGTVPRCYFDTAAVANYAGDAEGPHGKLCVCFFPGSKQK